jgi:hypothetical protein
LNLLQLAEALPGSVSAMMRAAGYTSEKDFFKAVEAGKIMASEVMPKFADELKKVARTNGALEATTKKTRAEMQRFFNQLTYAKDEIFQGGMNDGLSYMFSTLSDTLENLKPVAKALGGIFKGAVSALSGAFKLLVAPIEIVVQSIAGLWGMLGLGGAGNKVWEIVGAGGILVLLASRFAFIRNAVFGVNVQLLGMLANLARIAIPLLVIEDVWGSIQGKKSVTGQGGAWSAESLFGKSFAWMDRPLNSFGETKVVVEVKGDEAAKFVTATVDKTNQQRVAINQTETSQ